MRTVGWGRCRAHAAAQVYDSLEALVLDALEHQLVSHLHGFGDRFDPFRPQSDVDCRNTLVVTQTKKGCGIARIVALHILYMLAWV